MRARGILFLLLACALAGCVSTRTTTRPIAASVAVETRAVGMQAPQVRINCRAVLSKDEDLVRALIEERLREGNYYAALAQVQTLPAEVAVVAALRADILRNLESPQAEAWYRALQGSCLSGRAEHGLGLLAAGRGDYRAALQKLVSAAGLLPTDSRVRNDLGFVYLHLSQDRQAEFELRTAAELAPEDRMPQFNLALLALLGNNEDGWQFWSERSKFSASELKELVRSCQYLMRKRSGVETSVFCPINPLAAQAMPDAVKPGRRL